MSLISRLATVLLIFHGCLWAQATGATPEPSAESTAPKLPERQQPIYLELGGFTNFVNNNYGRWDGGTARIMYRSARFSPIFGFATQKRPEGSQQTYGMDSYISFSRWFYVIAGVGGSPQGTAVLFPKLRYGVTGMISIPGARGIVATLGAAQNHGDHKDYSRTLSAGAMYYRGRAILSGYISFNRNYPGAIPSKSGGMAVQYGAEKKFWIGGGMNGGRIAYQTISLQPLNVRFLSYGPNVFYQQWMSRKWGFILRYDYQNEIDAYQRHGISASLFFEIP
jgi:YaiO family outer membrane protein